MNDPADCTVLIAGPDLLPSLTERSARDTSELLTFADTEALRALEVISRRRPRVVALEQVFAATPRGTALINRIKADPTLAQSEIRVVARQDFSRVTSPPVPVAERPGGPPGGAAGPSGAAAVSAPAAPLDYRGTRRAPRYRIAPNVDADVNGSSAAVIDLSTVGVHVVSPTVLRPNQRLKVTFSDDHGAVRCTAVVAWASFEMPAKSGPRYRAGIALLDANAAAIDAFRRRHQAS